MSERRPDFSTVRGRLGWVTGRVCLVVLIALNLVVFEATTASVRNMLIEHLYGSSYHWVPCSRLPTPKEAQRVLDDNPHIVRQIHLVSPGHIGMYVNENPGGGSIFNVTDNCPGKADLAISFPGVREKDAIRKIIGDDKYFFGIPYRMHNT